MELTIDQLKQIIPKNQYASYWHHALEQLLPQYEINTPDRIAAFLAQCAHESGGFVFIKENLNYKWQSLRKVFPKYFITEAAAARYERQPERIANLVYANRMGNGPESSGDGFRYRGRGYIQLTGKINYQAFDKVVNDDITNNPDLVATKYPLLSAGWYWNGRGLNSIADLGATETVVTQITKKINGGTHGLMDRIAKFNKYYKHLTS